MERKVVLITGGGNGIGLAITRELLSGGRYLVGVIDLDCGKLGSLMERFPGRLKFMAGDISNESEARDAVESVMNEWGRVDILVNNACLALFGAFEDKSLPDTRREFEVNYWGTVNMIMAVLPHMKASGKGVIHNMSSGVGITGFPGIYGYASTKGALEALTRTLAIELKPLGITVNLVHPPLTKTRSSAPLGVPEQVMDDPERVGSRLAVKIGSSRQVITPDLMTGAGLFFSRHFPGSMGRMLARMTEKARKENVKS